MALKPKMKPDNAAAQPFDDKNPSVPPADGPNTKPEPEQTKRLPTPGQSQDSEAQNMIEAVYTGVAENTISESSYHPESLLRPYNPDDLFRKTGNYDIYEDMVRDDQVSVCLTLKNDLVIGSGWDIVSDQDDQEEITEDIQLALSEDTDVPFDDMLEELLTAYWAGFSLSEKIFKVRPDGSLTLRVLKTRHPATWLIHTDKHGNVEEYEQRGTREDLKIDGKSLIHYVVNRRFQNPYGTSDLRPAYAAWFTKRQIIRFYAMFLEKAAGPMPVARYDKNAPPEAVRDIHNAIKSFQSKTALTIPKEIEIEFLEAKSNGEVYNIAINLFNMFIGRSLFVPDLIGFHGDKTAGGSFALGKEQLNIFMKHIQRRRRSLEEIINKEIIWPIVFYNYGFVDNYPKFKLRPINDEDARAAAETWIKAMSSKIYVPSDEEVNHFRGIIKFPEGEVERGPDPTATPLPGQPPQPGMPGQDPKDPNAKPGQAGDKTAVPGDDPNNDLQDPKAKQFALGKAPPGDYCKKCDFKAMKRQLVAYDDSISRDIKPIVKLAIADMLDQMKQKKILHTGDISKMDSVKLKKLRDIKLLLNKSMKDVWVEGKNTAKSELFKGNYATKPVLPDQQFMDMVDQETYQFIGDWEYNVLKNARIEMIAAIKDGRPISSVIANQDQMAEDAEVSIERYARTKHTEVFNKGRVSFFQESGVVAAYQYSAIMDDVTSDICAELDGKIFAEGDQPIPPMHFNCRSTLVPITKYEDFKVSEKAGGMDIDAFIEENKGKGFPTQ